MRQRNRPITPARYRRYATAQPRRRQRRSHKIVLFAKRAAKLIWTRLAVPARFAFKALMMVLLPSPVERKTDKIYHDTTRWTPRSPFMK